MAVEISESFIESFLVVGFIFSKRKIFANFAIDRLRPEHRNLPILLRRIFSLSR